MLFGLLRVFFFFFFSSRRRHTRSKRDWSSDVCSSDLGQRQLAIMAINALLADPRAAATAIMPLMRIAVFGLGFMGSTDRKSTRLNSSHVSISYAVFCLKKKK